MPSIGAQNVVVNGAPAPARKNKSNVLKLGQCEDWKKHARTTLRLVTRRASGRVVELRFIGRGIASGYFDDLDKLVEAAFEREQRAQGTYLIPNPINPVLLARSSNRVADFAKNTTSDADVLSRCILMIDLDPVRPSGVSSTDEEHQLAMERAKEIRAWLRAGGWRSIALADSGNGAHLLVVVDLPNDDDSRTLVQRVLTVIASRFSDDRVKVDTDTYNAARLIKLYGTMARKGDSTADRPHRRSRLIEVPKKPKPTPKEMLESIAALMPQPSSVGHQSLDLDKWIAEHGLGVAVTAAWGPGGRKWVLERCPWNPQHTDRAAYIVQLPNGAVAAGCHHQSCASHDWADLRDLFEPGWRNAPPTTEQSAASAAQKLIEIGEKAELFRDHRNDAYAAVDVGGVRQILAVKSRAFQSYLCGRFYSETKKAPSGEALSSAARVIEAKAVYDGARIPLGNRFAWQDGTLWLDLCDDEARAVEITASAWRIVDKPPILFRRYKHQLPLPVPVPGGDVHDLFPFVNLRRADDGLLVMVWLVTSLLPHIPRPVLILTGTQGAAKTSAARFLRSLTDPSVVDSLSLGKTDRAELAQVLDHHSVPCFDNLSHMQKWQEDMLCCGVTGGALQKRSLYTDDEDSIFTFRRAIILTGINCPTAAPDLLDRSLLIGLERVPTKRRREESELWKAFEAKRPEILGGMLDALVEAMRVYPTLDLPRLSRMADFTRWGAAASIALGYDEDMFLDALTANADGQVDEILEADPIAGAVRSLVRKEQTWKGTATELFNKLDRPFSSRARDKAWPRSPHALAKCLRVLKATLATVGVEIEFLAGRREGRRIAIRSRRSAKRSSPSSSASS